MPYVRGKLKKSAVISAVFARIKFCKKVGVAFRFVCAKMQVWEVGAYAG